MSGLDVLLRLLIAHVLGDFVLQPRKWVDERRNKHHRSTALYVHSLLHGLLAWIAMGEINYWPVALIVAITHFGVELMKSFKDPKSAKWFVIDQGLHVAVLVGTSSFLRSLQRQPSKVILFFQKDTVRYAA